MRPPAISFVLALGSAACSGAPTPLTLKASCEQRPKVFELSDPPARIDLSVDQSPGRGLIAIVSIEGLLEVFDRSSGTSLFSQPNTFYAAFTSNGRLVTTSPDPERNGRRITLFDPTSNETQVLTERACANAILRDRRHFVFIDQCAPIFPSNPQMGMQGVLRVFAVDQEEALIPLLVAPGVFADERRGFAASLEADLLVYAEDLRLKSCGFGEEVKEGLQANLRVLALEPPGRAMLLGENSPAGIYGFAKDGLLAVGDTCDSSESQLHILSAQSGAVVDRLRGRPRWFYGPQINLHGPAFLSLGYRVDGLSQRAWAIVTPDGRTGVQTSVQLAPAQDRFIELDDPRRLIILGDAGERLLYRDAQNDYHLLDLDNGRPTKVLQGDQDRRAQGGARAAVGHSTTAQLMLIDGKEQIALPGAESLGFLFNDAFLFMRAGQLALSTPPYTSTQALGAWPYVERPGNPPIVALDPTQCAIAFGSAPSQVTVIPMR